MLFGSRWLMEVVRLRFGVFAIFFDLASYKLSGKLPSSRCDGAKVVAFARFQNLSSEFFANNALVVVCFHKIGHDSQSQAAFFVIENLLLYDTAHITYLSLLALSVLPLETSVHVLAIFNLGFNKLCLLVLSFGVVFQPLQAFKNLICQQTRLQQISAKPRKLDALFIFPGHRI